MYVPAFIYPLLHLRTDSLRLKKQHLRYARKCTTRTEKMICDVHTGSVKDPNFPRSEAIDPPGTNSRRMLRASSSRAVPK